MRRDLMPRLSEAGLTVVWTVLIGNGLHHLDHTRHDDDYRRVSASASYILNGEEVERVGAIAALWRPGPTMEREISWNPRATPALAENDSDVGKRRLRPPASTAYTMERLWRRGTLGPTSVHDAANELRRAIERRSRQVVVPGIEPLAVALPGVAQAMVDRSVRSLAPLRRTEPSTVLAGHSILVDEPDDYAGDLVGASLDDPVADVGKEDLARRVRELLIEPERQVPAQGPVALAPQDQGG